MSTVRAARQLSVFRNLPDADFDDLAAVLFQADFLVGRAALVPYSVVLEKAEYVGHVNGWRFHLEDAIWNIAGVEDVTDILAFAAASDGMPHPV